MTLFAAGLTAILPGFYPGGLSPITEYLPRDAIWVLDDPLELERQWGDLWSALEEAFSAARQKGELALPPDQHYLHERDVRPVLEQAPVLELSGLTLGGAEAAMGTAEVDFDLQPTAELRAEIQSHHGEDGALSPLVRRLEALRERGIAAVVACHSSAQAERARRLLLDRNLMAQIGPLDEALFSPHVHAHLVVGEISAGFVDPHDRLAVYSDEDIFGPRAQARRAPRKPRTFGSDGADFRDLKEGDLVVHVDHGIARYGGLTRLNVRGFAADFILLQFAGKDKLYLPVGRLRQIQKYTGGDPEKARLDSLKSQTFQKRKARVKEELLKMAAELLDIYAARAAHQGYAFSPPDVMYRTVRGGLRVRRDAGPGARHRRGAGGHAGEEADGPAGLRRRGLRQDRGRDARGLQGGGGQEAGGGAGAHHRARRAALPHLSEALQGLPGGGGDDLPAARREGDRGRSSQRAREGKVDVLIGTHRLLSADVGFKDLGLVVVDEEQRFGVKHKEQLKKLRKLVDVLTLTATPIPRTLHMSMMGVRDLSIIGTPPVDRRAIRTFVSKFDGATIKEAIERELSRGGQVFFLHNRIETIRGVLDYLAKLVPQAKIAVAHGQMRGGQAREGDDGVRGQAARRAALHRHHRERPRHPLRQHDPGRTAPTPSASRSSTRFAGASAAAASAPTPIC